MTGGPDLEETGSCNGKDYPPGYDAAAQLVAHARGLPYVEADRWLVVGQSFGGTTAITPAAQPPPGVRATVNFAGGVGRFVDLPAHGDDGHASFTRNTAAWRPPFEAFLAEAGFRIPG